MEQISVFDSRFAPYGQVLEGYDFAELLRIMEETTPCPEDGTVYVASVPELEVLSVAAELRDRGFGGMPIQIGYCNGANTRLSCLEYHRTSELDIAVSDMVLLVARQPEIVGGVGYWLRQGVLRAQGHSGRTVCHDPPLCARGGWPWIPHGLCSAQRDQWGCPQDHACGKRGLAALGRKQVGHHKRQYR